MYKNLPDGLRVIHIPSSSNVAYCGIAVHAGTRNEAPGQEGLAHFCEHLAFKGTRRRSAMKIINDIEGLGGELNAFTNKEDTVFYCVIERKHLRRAIDVLCDIVFCSEYPEQEVERECEVVCDEIDSYEDSPSELIYDEFENLLFEGHPLGHNILGTSEQVRRYTGDDARRFTRQWYRPENCVLFVNEERRMKNEEFATATGSEGPVAAANSSNSEAPVAAANSSNSEAPVAAANSSFFILHSSLTTPIIRDRGTHQAHVMLGTQAFSAGDDRRWALYLLNNILGGPGMNSRLNLALRERHGLVYTVESSMTSYSDTGLWTVYFGCDAHDTQRCLKLTRHELDRLMLKPLSEAQLRAAKRQLQGQLAIAMDNQEQRVLDYARTFLHTGHGRTLADVMDHINRLTVNDLQQAAQQLFAPERLLTLIYK